MTDNNSDTNSLTDIIVDFVREQKQNPQCLFKPRDMLSVARFIPDSKRSIGSGIWANIGDRSKYGFTLIGELDVSLTKYGDNTITLHYVSASPTSTHKR